MSPPISPPTPTDILIPIGVTIFVHALSKYTSQN